MSFIEGIGDEVTILASVLILATTLFFAWLSTFVSDRPRLMRTASPTGTSEAEIGENTRDADGRIDEVINSGGIENIRTELGSSSEAGRSADISNAAQNEQEQVQNAGSIASLANEESFNESETGRTKGSSDSESHQDLIEPSAHTVHDENSPSNVIRNRLTSQTHPPYSDDSDIQSVQSQTSTCASLIQTGDNQSEDAMPTVTNDAQTDQVLEEIPSNRQDSNQSDEQTPSDGWGEATEGSVCIRIKYLTDRERVVYTNPTETLGDFRQRTFSEEINSGQTVRLIFNGHLLRDDNSSLSDLNITQDCVIHCLLSQNATPSDSRPDIHEADVDLGRFMVPLFMCILGFVWYLRWQYRHMFNATSTLSLVGVTSLFVLAVLASWRG